MLLWELLTKQGDQQDGWMPMPFKWNLENHGGLAERWIDQSIPRNQWRMNNQSLPKMLAAVHRDGVGNFAGDADPDILAPARFGNKAQKIVCEPLGETQSDPTVERAFEADEAVVSMELWQNEFNRRVSKNRCDTAQSRQAACHHFSENTDALRHF